MSVKDVVSAVLTANPTQAAEARSGKEKAFNSLIGQIIKALGGAAPPAEKIAPVLTEALAELGTAVAGSMAALLGTTSSDGAGVAGGFKGLKTFPSGYGTTYATVALAKGLSLSFTPKIESSGPVVGIFLRVRAQKEDPSANLSAAEDLFGFPFVEKSPNHASTEIFIAVELQPTDPFRVGQKVHEQGLVDKLLDELYSRVTKAGTKMLAPVSVLKEYVTSRLEDSIPTSAPKTITEFPVVVGADAIQARYQTLYAEFGSSKGNPMTPPGDADGSAG